MLLHANIPRRFWFYAISHATYLDNMTSSSRMDRSKTIYEILFRRRPDITRIPPYGAFACIYKKRRELKDQDISPTGTRSTQSSPAERIQRTRRQPTFLTNRHGPRDQLDCIRSRTIYDKGRRTPYGRSEEGTSIPSISQENTSQMVRYRQRPARRHSRLRRRLFRRHSGHTFVINRLRLPRQRRCHIMALNKNTTAGA